METGLLLWANHVTTYWAAVAAHRQWCRTAAHRTKITPELLQRAVRVQTEAILPVILIGSLCLRSDPLPLYASLPLFVVLADVFVHAARRWTPDGRRLGALDASWVESVAGNALPMTAAIVLSGADLRAAHLMTFAATCSTVHHAATCSAVHHAATSFTRSGSAFSQLGSRFARFARFARGGA